MRMAFEAFLGGIDSVIQGDFAALASLAGVMAVIGHLAFIWYLVGKEVRTLNDRHSRPKQQAKDQ